MFAVTATIRSYLLHALWHKLTYTPPKSLKIRRYSSQMNLGLHLKCLSDLNQKFNVTTKPPRTSFHQNPFSCSHVDTCGKTGRQADRHRTTWRGPTLFNSETEPVLVNSLIPQMLCYQISAQKLTFGCYFVVLYISFRIQACFRISSLNNTTNSVILSFFMPV